MSLLMVRNGLSRRDTGVGGPVMRAGKLLQVGSPRDIYNRPVDRFVADFIGETNFLPGVAQGGTVRLSSGDIVALDGPAMGNVTLTVRPEQVRIVAAGEDGAMRATVTAAVYFGTDTHVHLALTDGTPLVARMQSLPSGEMGLTKGTPVGLKLAAGAVQVLA